MEKGARILYIGNKERAMGAKIKIENGVFQITIPVKEAYENEDLKSFLDLQRVKEITSRSQITDSQIEELTDEVKKSWWDANSDWFLNEAGH